MRKIIIALLPVFFALQAFGQTGRKVSVYVQAQYSITVTDKISENNPWAVGAGIQGFLNTHSKFKPTIEFTADAYRAGNKMLRLGDDGEFVEYVSEMYNLLAGSSFQLVDQVYVSLLAGPSFTNGRPLAAIKPALGIYISKNQRWVFKMSYTHVFDREPVSKHDFGAASFALGLRLF